MKKLYLALPLGALLLQGCGVTMARYEPNYQNVQQLKQNAPMQPMREAQVKADSGQDSLMVRLNPISSFASCMSTSLLDYEDILLTEGAADSSGNRPVPKDHRLGNRAERWLFKQAQKHYVTVSGWMINPFWQRMGINTWEHPAL
ncbi:MULTISPECIES: hypothetical protein [unclassified Pseudomonas]|uniref:Lipoprotein n=1 Tax=Pseudomonas sp. 13.2 TaxID=3144665 RepID=A0AAU7BHF1_9PSED|nr:hypothetical protein [Pseudomonas sp. SWI36]